MNCQGPNRQQHVNVPWRAWWVFAPASPLNDLHALTLGNHAWNCTSSTASGLPSWAPWNSTLLSVLANSRSTMPDGRIAGQPIWQVGQPPRPLHLAARFRSFSRPRWRPTARHREHPSAQKHHSGPHPLPARWRQHPRHTGALGTARGGTSRPALSRTGHQSTGCHRARQAR